MMGGEAGDGPNEKNNYSYSDIFKYFTAFSNIDSVFFFFIFCGSFADSQKSENFTR